MPPLLSLQGVRVAYGAAPLFADLDVHVAKGDRIALVGRNGTGKSTLLQILAGQIVPDTGQRIVQPGARVAYLPQVPDFSGFETAHDAVLAALPPELSHEPWRVDAALDALSLPGDRSVVTLSGGELRRTALARMVVMDADLLLLDEPTNHLDLPTIEWLERTLEGLRAGMVIVSHDRAFLTRLSKATLWLDRGRLSRTEQGFARFEAWSEQVLNDEALAQGRLDKKIQEETRWSREGISARRKRNQGRLQRLHDMRSERAALRQRVGGARLNAEAGDASGKRVIEVTNIKKAYGDRVLVRGLSTTIIRGDRVGLVGPNGSGKSTLLKLLLGQIEPDAGTVVHGTQLTPVVIDQHRTRIDPEQTIQEVLCEPGTDQVMVQGKLRHVAGYLRDFLFEGGDARRPVKGLSGGERARLLLALELKRPSNLLVLDEPTNDLDLETLDLLQEVLEEYAGTLLLVSHDRDFLDRLVTSTIAYEGDGHWIEYAGGYSDLLKQRALGAAAAAEKADRTDKSQGSGRNAPARTAAAPPPPPKPEVRKLSFKEQRAYDDLPQQLAQLEAEIVDLDAQLADGEFYVRDPKAFMAATDRVKVARTELARAEEQWLEFEERIEALAKASRP